MTSTAFEQTAQDATQSLPPSLSAEDMRLLRQRSNVMGAYLVLHAWGLIGGAMALCVAWPHPLSFLLAFVVIGNRQLGLAVLMHDAAHRLLFENPVLNDRVGHWLCGAPVGASLKLYRPYHLSHHRHTQQEQDPDLMLSAPFPITTRSLRRKVVRDLLGMTGYQRRATQFRAAMGDSTGLLNRLSALWNAEKSFFISNIILCAVLALWLGWCMLPEDLNWRHLLGAGMLGGIGFTMSIFITNLAFSTQPEMIDASKLAVFSGSLLAAVLGSIWLAWVGRRSSAE